MLYVESLIVGLAAGTMFGVFGAGGSALATPLLALLGVPPIFAVASPLPAVLPAAAAGARRHLRADNLDARIAQLAVVGGLPGALIGALLSGVVADTTLIVLSGLLLAIAGGRMLWTDAPDHQAATEPRREGWKLIVGASFGAGLVAGLLANGGGFVLVPMFVLLLGLSISEAGGTSMVVVGILTVPTLLTHWALGHIDWSVALAFGLGMLPGSFAGAHISQMVPADLGRRVFGSLLLAFAAWFLSTRI